jgi:tetratricopeptide (TPR) repeat protein
MEEGFRLLSNHKYKEALEELNKIDDLTPPIFNLHLLRSSCLLGLGKIEEAHPEIIRELLWYPSNIAACNLRGTIKELIDASRSTKTASHQVLVDSSRPVSENVQIGLKHLMKGEPEVTLKYFEFANNAGYREAGFFFNQARTLYLIGQEHAAIEMLEREIVEYPNEHEASNYIAAITHQKMTTVFGMTYSNPTPIGCMNPDLCEILYDVLTGSQIPGDILLLGEDTQAVEAEVYKVIAEFSLHDRKIIKSLDNNATSLKLAFVWIGKGSSLSPQINSHLSHGAIVAAQNDPSTNKPTLEYSNFLSGVNTGWYWDSLESVHWCQHP